MSAFHQASVIFSQSTISLAIRSSFQKHVKVIFRADQYDSFCLDAEKINHKVLYEWQGVTFSNELSSLFTTEI
jgi:hypothetical protein